MMDIEQLKVDVWLFSMNQQEIIMLARDYCERINKAVKPTILLHSILFQTFCVFWRADVLTNLLEDPEYQNERDPGRTIFMQDEENASDWSFIGLISQFKLFPLYRTFASMEELIVDYESGDLDYADVKLAFKKAINNILKVTVSSLKSYYLNHVGSHV
ncbi:hypothetical protein PR202_ga09264 [Eleusine coracana subsp. coracana]|uniref:Uncharacterized protein n=1 Tax=Eleusine coracana subsp. coracana TaxID=191504 RepID=A0AAV5C4P0_ELECO|nr:hypothetical protein PR202_ga09264 [Eleusine coracana subsp. coracana]